MGYELWLGLRYLFAKRQEKFISLIAVLSIGGVALGVAALIVVLSVMTGFDHDIKDKLVGTNAHIIVDAPAGMKAQETGELMSRLTALEHVQGASPYITGQAILRLPEQAFGVLVRGIDAEREAQVNQLGQYLVDGRLPSKDGDVVVGTELAAFLGVRTGDPLKIISPADGKTHELSVAGQFRSGMYEYDMNLVVLSIPDAQRLFHLDGLVTGIGLRLDTLEHADEVQRTAAGRIPAEYRVRTWMELNPALFGALKVEKTVMFVILTLIIVVAALNITSMLIMMVMEKTKDIGILRALGAAPGSVAALFLAQGTIIGTFGAGLGLAGGVALAANLNPFVQWMDRTFGISLFPPTIYYLDHIPTLINMQDVVTITASALVLTMLAGTYAAYKAARLSPVDALRFQ